MGAKSLFSGGETGIESEAWRQAEHDLRDHLQRQPDIESASVIGGVGGDGGKDVIAKGVDGTTYIAEAKHWTTNKVHQSVVTGHAERHGTDGKELIVYAGANDFTEPARTAAEDHGVRLLTADDLGRGGLADAIRRSTPSVEQARAAMPSPGMPDAKQARDTASEAAPGLDSQLESDLREAIADVDLTSLGERAARATGRALWRGIRLAARGLWRVTRRALAGTRRLITRLLVQTWIAISWVVTRTFLKTAELIAQQLGRVIEDRAKRMKIAQALTLVFYAVLAYLVFRAISYGIRRVFYTDDAEPDTAG